MMDLTSAERRYWTDPVFRNLVEAIEAGIERLQFTPSEAREAATYACYRVEQRKPMRFPIAAEERKP